MKSTAVMVLLATFTFVSCAALSERHRMEKFEDVSDGYRRALLSSDFRGAAGFIDPADMRTLVDFDRYRLVKIVDYKPTRADVSEDRLSIEQDVIIQYYLININRLRSMQQHQVWGYDEAQERWLLRSGLPQFN